jgi:subtilisin family serine protease
MKQSHSQNLEARMPTIVINGIAIDPTAPKPMLTILGLENSTAENSDYLIIQTRHPLNGDERAALAAAGAATLEAISGDALICYFPASDIGRIRALPFVRWAELYPAAVKIMPTLLGLFPAAGGVPAAIAAAADPGQFADTRRSIDVVLQRNVDVREVAASVAAAAHVPVAEVDIAAGKLRLTAKLRRLRDIAAVDAVHHIEEVPSACLHNTVARQVLRVPAGNPAPGGGGAGEIVAIADTGFDKGSTTDVHPAFAGRVQRLYALARNRADDPDGHGTHVAGSVLGDGDSPQLGKVQGTAPRARLVLQAIGSGGGSLTLPTHLAQLFGPPYDQDGARIHSNSWGSRGMFGVYDAQARELDQFVHDRRDMLICFAAGNSGSDRDRDGQVNANTITPPGTAKNCLTVGASENNRPDKTVTYGGGWPAEFPAEPIRSDRLADNPNGLAAFSSRGPVQLGRLKPDVVAPGTFVLSARSRVTASHGWQLSADPLYMFEGGTSMATPLVAGCVANIRAFLRTAKGLASPSAALLKAAIINGARPLAGQYNPAEIGAVPDGNAGFGRVDLAAVIGPYAAGEMVEFIDEDAALDVGESLHRSVDVAAGGHIKVTLVWTDPPGEALQTDLDLIVRAGGAERHGNMPPGSAAFDRANNVEQVTWSGLPGGRVEVIVRAHRVTFDSQTFALVVRTS